MNSPSAKEISDWRDRLVHWFRKHGRDYPWRRTEDPYAILVSELMLQQTRIKAVLEKRYFENWMERFPDLESLAESEVEDVLKAWEGLGYYNRARNLQAAARHIREKNGGVFPDTLEEILALPGVGPYTAGGGLQFCLRQAGSHCGRKCDPGVGPGFLLWGSGRCHGGPETVLGLG